MLIQIDVATRQKQCLIYHAFPLSVNPDSDSARAAKRVDEGRVSSYESLSYYYSNGSDEWSCRQCAYTRRACANNPDSSWRIIAGFSSLMWKRQTVKIKTEVENRWINCQKDRERGSCRESFLATGSCTVDKCIPRTSLSSLQHANLHRYSRRPSK